MQFLIQHYLQLVKLKAKPQDCPASMPWQFVLMIVYLLLSIINSQALYEFDRGFILSLADLIFLYLFVQLLLMKHRARMHQTLNALLGSSIIVGIIHTPLSFYFITDKNKDTIPDMGNLLFFALFVWIVVVYGHIIRHAIEVSLSAGVMISLAYIFLNAIVIFSIANAFGY